MASNITMLRSAVNTHVRGVGVGKTSDKGRTVLFRTRDYDSKGRLSGPTLDITLEHPQAYYLLSQNYEPRQYERLGWVQADQERLLELALEWLQSQRGVHGRGMTRSERGEHEPRPHKVYEVSQSGRRILNTQWDDLDDAKKHASQLARKARGNYLAVSRYEIETPAARHPLVFSTGNRFLPARGYAEGRPVGPASGFGNEHTEDDYEARIEWEQWAAQRARAEGHEATAQGHDLAAAAYHRERTQKFRAL